MRSTLMISEGMLYYASDSFKGYFSDKHGLDKLLHDLDFAIHLIKKNHPNVPIFVLDTRLFYSFVGDTQRACTIGLMVSHVGIVG